MRAASADTRKTKQYQYAKIEDMELDGAPAASQEKQEQQPPPPAGAQLTAISAPGWAGVPYGQRVLIVVAFTNLVIATIGLLHNWS
jgi:hypothetical protein